MPSLVFHLYMSAVTLFGVARYLVWIAAGDFPKDPTVGLVAAVALQVMLLALAWFTASAIKHAKDLK
ncbi:hypothetical protein PP641_gp003 [Arthrobacter phage SilentRX]|uniref:Uncharacterized protein n=1 Tax=Arthrobacter phage SilentRX TaxID=2836091 RepID=A0A8F3IPN2_9CAUD|nr:hypothetical protein PP641_gp003 [Arthrobacter phage SilentRX]QWY82749.1 hypothetical protein SEA_SILENTRX_3 [Arthrobacter phage SilentRX]